MSTTLNQLVQEVRGCTLCTSHLPFPPKPIIQIDSQAQILIAGQAPGRKVQDTGIPFNDASGKRLRSWMGLDSEQFYNPKIVAILPMGFCFPGSTTSGDLPPRSECAPAWRNRLLDLLPNIELTLLIGKYAQNWHLPEQQKLTLTNTVKDWNHYWPSVLPLPHPSPRNNRWLKQNPWFETDVIPALQKRIADICSKPK